MIVTHLVLVGFLPGAGTAVITAAAAFRLRELPPRHRLGELADRLRLRALDDRYRARE